MTVAETLRAATAQLAETSDTARLDAELLMADALGVSRSDMLLRHQDDRVPAVFDRHLVRRLRHEPIAYILERQEFFGRDFIVNSAVLIPRGDSESVVDIALGQTDGPVRVLDLGTGSGALLLTVLAERPGSEGIGIDASLGAMAVAAANAARLGLANRARILHRDWTQVGWADGLGHFDLILANPPYVETDARLDPDVRHFEPASALFAGADGLDDYRIIIPQLRGLLADGGCAVLEIGFRQGDAVQKLGQDAGFAAELFPDLAGRPRAVVLR